MSEAVEKMKWYSKIGAFFKKFDNYALAIMLTFLVISCLAVIAVSFHEFPIDVIHQWLYDLLEGTYAYFLVSRTISGMGYVFRPIDIALKDATIFELSWRGIKERAKNFLRYLWNNITDKPAEFFGLILGLVSGLGISIAFGLMGVKVSPLYVIKSIGIVLSYIGSISTFSGLFNRLGRSVDFYAKKLNNKWLNEKDVNYVLSVTAGIVLGFVLLGIILGMNALPGGGLVLAVASIGVISTCASSSGYVGRLFDTGGIFHAFSFLKIKDYFRNDKEEDRINTQKITNDKKAECYGTAIGVGVGTALAIALIVIGVATLPFFGLGLPSILAGVIVVGTCLSVSGGLGNRIGYVIDKKRQVKEMLPQVEERHIISLLAAKSDVLPVSTPISDSAKFLPQKDEKLSQKMLTKVGSFAPVCKNDLQTYSLGASVGQKSFSRV